MLPYSSESHRFQHNKMMDVLIHTSNAFSKNGNERLLRNFYDTLCGRRITHTPRRDNKQHFAVKYNGGVEDRLWSEQYEIIVTFTFNEGDSIRQVDIYLLELDNNALGGVHQRLSTLRGFEYVKYMERRPYGTAKLIESINPNEVFAKRG